MVRQLGTRVDGLHDRVTVAGAEVRPRRKLYVALHKPRGFLCTRRDPEDRSVLADLLPKEWSELHPVGRLDKESEGLIFLTNDGAFTLRLTHPRYGVEKTYVATVSGSVDPAQLPALTAGIRDGGDLLRAKSVRLLKAGSRSSTVEAVMAEGKNHEVRRLFASLGHPVEILKRIRIGPIRLGELPVGKWRVLGESELKSLLRDPA